MRQQLLNAMQHCSRTGTVVVCIIALACYRLQKCSTLPLVLQVGGRGGVVDHVICVDVAAVAFFAA